MKTITTLVALLVLAGGPCYSQTSARTVLQPDKIKHFAAGAFIAGTVQTFAHEMGCSRSKALLFGFGAGCLGAAAKELYDMKGHGTPSLKDAFWTGVGVGVTSVTLRCTMKTETHSHAIRL